MPDWTYHTLLKPALMALPRARAHQEVLRSMALLAKAPGGSHVLEFFGHMQPDPRLQITVGELRWSTPIGIGSALDPRGIAGRAWARFGVGFVEAGAECGTPSAGLPTWVRLAPASVGSLRTRIASLKDLAVGFVLESSDSLPRAESFALVRAVAKSFPDKPWRRLLLVAVDVRTSETAIDLLVEGALEAGADGIRLDTGWSLESDPLDSATPETLASVLRTARRLRHRFGREPVLIAGGAETPADVLELRHAGVDLVALDSGLVRSGPGLPKRVNAALLFQSTGSHSPVEERPRQPWARQSWFWSALLGASMLLGGSLALGIASTRVVLPYDEVWCSTTRAGFAAINPRLLPFMAHDRVTLAGTMISIGGLYLGLALGAVRRGAHWARKTIITSATSGFLSFFLFLGFGYFDPFHAFVTAILSQYLVLALYAPLDQPQPVPYPELGPSAAWRRGQWAQLLFVLLGLGLTGAGVVIASIGIRGVFVREDLEFLGTTLESLRAANPRLIPVVAHDRASLGGMLIANGLGVWLAAQWGFVAGARWLWWTLVLSGIPAFAGAIGVHLAVGYTDPWHLAPAVAGAVLFALASTLAHGWLCSPEAARRSAWRAFLGPGPSAAE